MGKIKIEVKEGKTYVTISTIDLDDKIIMPDEVRLIEIDAQVQKINIK